MGNLATTYQHIADILSYVSSRDALEKTLSNKDYNWDTIVIEGSKHLVLPAIYCRLKSKGLTHLLPEELHAYLEEITSLNRIRNTEIVSQIHSLSELLKAHNIEHVFLKGAALISSNYYDDIAERMLGDIDVLVSEHDLDTAHELLKSNGYYSIGHTLGYDFFEHRHLPRMKTDDLICAVELHSKLLDSDTYEELTSAHVLASRQIVNGIAIPSSNHITLYTILNYQVNDNGSLYNSISFRSAYDTIALLKHSNYACFMLKDKKIRSYFDILAMFFEDIPKELATTNFTTTFYHFKLKHVTFYKFWNRLLKIYLFSKTVLNRVPHFFVNKAYRKALFKDSQRIMKLFTSFYKNNPN